MFVSHDLDEALKLGCRIAIMRDGRLIQVGTPEEIIAQPADDYVSAFVEGADRTQVLTAGQIMRRPTVTAHPQDAPRTLLLKMERSGFGGLVVVDNARRLHGYISLDSVISQRDHKRLDPDSLQPLPTATPETKLGELIGLITEQGSPVVILDAKERVIGIVDKSTLLAALAQLPAEEHASGPSPAPQTQPA